MEYVLAICGAFWLGILTSINPCPLATNIAALSFISQRFQRPRQVILSGLLYTAGRPLVYLVLGVVLVAGLTVSATISIPLQRAMNQLLGPTLIIAGMFLLGLLNLNLPGMTMTPERKEKLAKLGIWNAPLLGILFALSMCPASAAIFFLSLIPLAVKHQSAVVLPAIYGAATGVPVVAVAIVFALGVRSTAKALNGIAAFGKWSKRVTGVGFIGIGFHFCLRYVYHLY